MTDKKVTKKEEKKPVVKKATKASPTKAKETAAKKTAAVKQVAKKEPKAKPLSQTEKKVAQTLTKEIMREFDAGSTLPINMRIPTPVVPTRASTVNHIDGRPSILELARRIQDNNNRFS